MSTACVRCSTKPALASKCSPPSNGPEPQPTLSPPGGNPLESVSAEDQVECGALAATTGSSGDGAVAVSSNQVEVKKPASKLPQRIITSKRTRAISISSDSSSVELVRHETEGLDIDNDITEFVATSLVDKDQESGQESDGCFNPEDHLLEEPDDDDDDDQSIDEMRDESSSAGEDGEPEDGEPEYDSDFDFDWGRTEPPLVKGKIQAPAAAPAPAPPAPAKRRPGRPKTKQPAKKKRKTTRACEDSESEDGEHPSEPQAPTPNSPDYTAAVFKAGVRTLFLLPFSLTFPEVRTEVARNLEAFTDSLKIQYRIDGENEKSKGIVTNLSSENDFKIFLKTIRDHYTVPLTAAGRPSTARLKQVIVVFINANAPDLGGTNEAAGAKGKQAPLKKDQKRIMLANENIGTIEDGLGHIRLELQNLYSCAPHAKLENKSAKDVYCWKSPENESVHYVIALGDFHPWAAAINRGAADYDDPPPLVRCRFTVMRKRTHQSSGKKDQSQPAQIITPQGNLYAGLTTQAGYGAQPIIVQPPPYYHQPQYHQYPPQPTLQQGGQLPAPAPAANEVSSQGPQPNAQITFPQIRTWLLYIDAHPERQSKRTTYANFADDLEEEEFERLDRITPDTAILKLEDFMKALKTDKIGIATSLLRYAKEDIELIRAGKLTIPEAA